MTIPNTKGTDNAFHDNIIIPFRSTTPGNYFLREEARSNQTTSR